MKTQEMDRHTRDALRNLERNESFQDRLNLTAAQGSWEDAYQLIKKPISTQSTLELPYSCMGFFQMKNADSGVMAPFTEGELIVRAERVFVASLNRIDSRHWKGHNQRRKYRLNFQTHRLRRDGDGELWADSFNDDKAWQDRLVQKDLVKPPMQDHPRYQMSSFNPNGAFATLQDPVLKAPVSGKFSLSVNDRHVELCIGDIPVYRLMAEQAATILTHADDSDLAEDGQHVKKGHPLIKLTTRCEYGEIKWTRRHDRIADMDLIGGDVLSATREESLLSMASEMMLRIGRASSEDELEDAMEVKALERWAPRHLIEYQASVLDGLPMLDEWQETAALRNAVLAGLQPKGGLFVRADVSETTTFEGSTEYPHYLELRFGNGHTQVVPKTAVVLEHVTQGSTVGPETPIADWAERRFFENWEDVRSALPQSAHVVREFLQQTAILPGTSGFQGEGLLIDQQFLPEIACVREGSVAHHVDLRPASEYLTEQGVIIGCPLKHEDWTDWYRTASGIGYNHTPAGERLSGNPVVATGSGGGGRYDRR